MKLKYKIIILIVIILTIVVGGIGWITLREVEKTVETQMGNNAMDLAQTVASMEPIQRELGTTKDYRAIQSIVEGFREKTRFQYIIVMDMQGIKYSYPYENSLGKIYKSGGEERVLQKGEAYVSADRNVLISAIRAFVPIYYNGEQVGAVLVGLLNDTVNKEISKHINNFHLTLYAGFLLGMIGAALLSHNIRKSIYGLEPGEIALLLGQREVILQSLKNGIVAIDEHGKLLLFNKTAKKVLGLCDEDQGKRIEEISPLYGEELMHTLETERSVYNQEIRVSTNRVILSSHSVLRDPKDEVIGAVSSFQDLTEMRLLAEELIGIQKMTNDLRAQNHEFMNKLHTISGLIQLEEYDKVVEYVEDISNKNSQITNFINRNILNPHIAGILLAKFFKAEENKIKLELDSQTYVDQIPNVLSSGDLCSIIGNLIENAMDVLIGRKDGKIKVRLKTEKENFTIRIQDNGPGIDQEIQKSIFERGITSKKGKRGYGLWIIHQLIERAKGDIRLIQDKGTIWEISIPLGRSKGDDTSTHC